MLIKIFLIISLGLAFTAGAGLALVYLKVIPVPSFLNGIPGIGAMVSSQDDNGLSNGGKLSPLQEENHRLRQEIQRMKRDMDNLKKRLREAEEKQGTETKGKPAESGQIETGSSQEELFKELAGYYSSIKARDAAEIFNELDDDTIIGILQNMEPEDAAKIMAAMPAGRAATITRKMLRVAESGT